VDDALRRAVTGWADADVDADDADAARQALAAAAQDDGLAADLHDAFTGGLAFGTAGLRGRMGPGPNRMNRAVVTRAAAGLAAYLREEVGVSAAAEGPAGREPLVVVGFDARRCSAAFATDSAAVLTAAGCRVVLLPSPLPTPVLAHAVRRLGADAGVMVTASHNPKDDNGYKVYLGGRAAPGPGEGVQIVPPADTGIAARIDAAPQAKLVPRTDGGWQVAGEELVDGYVTAVTALLLPGPRDLRVVTTAMHGVGGALLQRVLTEAGFVDVATVPAQADPDPAFPTVPFPNPEEPGALELALAQAAGDQADLVLAVDPDADRCSAAVPDPALGPPDSPSGWRQLTGDEVGALLAEHVLTRQPAATSPDPGEPITLAASLVSGSLIHRVAAHHGARSAATLTGFKWIARVPGLVMGYEEAIGYCVAPPVVRDKDGISAAVVLAELAAALQARGRTLLDALDELHIRHGVHLTAPVTLRVADMSVVGPVLARLLAEPPTDLAGVPLSSAEDLSVGVDGLPATPGVRLRSSDDVRVVVRPSGTEPKLKAYLEVVVPAGEDLAAARTAARQRLEQLEEQVRALLRGGPVGRPARAGALRPGARQTGSAPPAGPCHRRRRAPVRSSSPAAHAPRRCPRRAGRARSATASRRERRPRPRSSPAPGCPRSPRPPALPTASPAASPAAADAPRPAPPTRSSAGPRRPGSTPSACRSPRPPTTATSPGGRRSPGPRRRRPRARRGTRTWRAPRRTTARAGPPPPARRRRCHAAAGRRRGPRRAPTTSPRARGPRWAGRPREGWARCCRVRRATSPAHPAPALGCSA
jgi:phosphomannomutase